MSDILSNLTNDGVRAYSYDAANRLIGGGSPAGSLSYDGLGRLDTLVGANGGRYLYSGVEAVAFADPSTNIIANHFVRGPRPVEGGQALTGEPVLGGFVRV